MKKNIGSMDKTVRTIVAAIIAVLYFTGVVTGTFAFILLIVVIVLKRRPTIKAAKPEPDH